MGLTAEQLRIIQVVAVTHSGDQTPEQARGLAAADFMWLCQLEGIAPPSAANVLAALADA